MSKTDKINLSQRAGVFVQQPAGFRAFIPKPLPPDPLVVPDEDMQSKLALAERNLGRLDALSVLVPDPHRFVYMYVRQEAVLSSQIEGTQASLSDLLQFEAAENKVEGPADVSEVVNYVAALEQGMVLLEKLPISTRLLCRAHAILVAGGRGGDPAKTPGELRRSQNWIGGTRPSDAVFVPPPVDEMKRAMSDLERFLNAKKRTPQLIEIGLAHAQFETIHPFLDGNGRVGRLLITFLLAAHGALSKPLLYLSYHFKMHRQEYYDRLQAVRTRGDWEGWLRFFLDAVAAVAAEATDRARRIVALREDDQRRIRKAMGRRAALALDLLEILIERPVVTSRLVRQRLARSQPTIDRLLSDLVKLKILSETTGQQWGRRFSYQRYMALFEKAAE